MTESVTIIYQEPSKEELIAIPQKVIDLHYGNREPNEHMTEFLAHRLLMIYCMEFKLHIPDIMAINTITRKMLSIANKTIEGFSTLTTDRMASIIKDLPPNTPILIEMSDENTRRNPAAIINMPWESTKISKKVYEEMSADDLEKFKPTPHEDGFLISFNSQYLLAFGAYVTKNSEGKMGVCVHYSY